ncbi:MAG: mechanosensitive ion channel [Rhodospirillales bacterium]|nr:mechanosensitive ion channel [Rhodospirillales bacterium]
MNKSFDFNKISQLGQDIFAWIQDHVFVIPNLVQLAAVLGAYLLARMVDKPLKRALNQVLAGEWANRYRLHAEQVIRPLIMPLVWLVLVGAGQFAALSLKFPAAILAVGVSLLTAWVVIRLLLNFVADPWWAKAVAVSVWSYAALDIVGLLTPTLKFMDQLSVNLGDFRLSLLSAAKSVVALAVFLWIANWASRLVENRLHTLKHITPSQQVLFSKLARVLFITIAILVAINAVGIDLTALAVFSGALGLGIGFGLQKVVANLISGVILLMDRSVKPGDVIAIGNTYGWVSNIGARYVSIVTNRGIEHLIPNEQLISTPVENWSFSDRNVRVGLPFGISYDADLRKAIALAMQAAEEFPRVLKDPPPRCLLKAFGASSVDMELGIWIADAEQGLSNIKSDIYLRIWDLFHEHSIQFPYAQLDVHMVGASEIKIAPDVADLLAQTKGS